MFKTRPVCRMRARHEALARDVAAIHDDEFMRVYGYRKVWRQLIDQGWDPAQVGRDQIARIMRGLGIRGGRRRQEAGHHDPLQGRGRQA